MGKMVTLKLSYLEEAIVMVMCSRLGLSLVNAPQPYGFLGDPFQISVEWVGGICDETL